MSLLQKALRNGDVTIDQLQASPYNIKVKAHPKYPNLLMFKYNQIESPMSESLVQEARGVVLDSANNWNVVAFPFKKFFNADEYYADKIDWTSAKVQEKLDGSLMILYHYDGVWQVASSGLPDAGGQVNGNTMSFADLFWKTWNDSEYRLPESGLEHFTFMFEMMTPYNRVVVPHKEARVVLIGVRNNVTFDEVSPMTFAGQDWAIVRDFSLKSLEDVIKSFEHFDGIDQEGYVVVDANFNRVKIKHPGYVAIHHLKGDVGPSHKKMFGIVCAGESDEVLSYFPEWKPIYDEVSEAFEALLHQLDNDYVDAVDKTKAAFNGIITNPARMQKEFASHAVKSKCQDALFKMRAGKIASFREYFRGISVEHSMKIIGKREWLNNE